MKIKFSQFDICNHGNEAAMSKTKFIRRGFDFWINVSNLKIKIKEITHKYFLKSEYFCWNYIWMGNF